MEMINLILADDEVSFRKTIAFILQREQNMHLLYEANNGCDLLLFLSQQKVHPNIIIMDIKMPHLNGIEATMMIQKMYPNIKIIALTSYDTPSFMANMLHIGAVSYLVKNALPIEIIYTVNQVHDKGFYYNNKMIQVIKQGIVPYGDKHFPSLSHNDFTAREIQVLELLCKQYNNAQIAQKLQLSITAVQASMSNLLLKTNTSTMAALVVYALQQPVFNL